MLEFSTGQDLHGRWGQWLPWYDVRLLGTTLDGELMHPSTWVIPWGSIAGSLVYLAKVAVLSVLQVIIRWTLPRFRYDQLMNLCWKIMLPISLVLVVATVGCLLHFGAP